METSKKVIPVFLIVASLLALMNSHVGAVPMATVQAGLTVYKEIVSQMQNGIKSLFITEQLTQIAKILADLNLDMQTKQKEALSVILSVNTKAVVAIQSARTVVGRIKNICDTLLFVLKNPQINKDKEKTKIAIEIFLKESKIVQPIIDQVVVKMTEVAAQSLQIQGQFVILSSWANLKKEELKTKVSDAVKKERAKAYASAVACIFLPITCPAIYAAAALITELDKVKEIETRFGKGLTGLESMKKEITEIGRKTQELVRVVKTKKKELETIQGQLDLARMNGDLTKNYYDLFFQRFKGSVQTLYDQCVAYLNDKNYKAIM